MTDQTERIADAPESRYDLIVRLPDGSDPATFRQPLLQSLGLNPVKAEQLLQHLVTHGASRVRREVSREEAEQAMASFRAAGLETELKAVLSLLAKDAILAESVCPGCQRSMRPTPQRQCPYCFIYLDKVDRDKLRLKQIRDEELRKLNARLQREDELNGQQQQEDSERALRNRIRAELERELGLHRPWHAFFRGARGAVRAGVIVTLLGGAFWGGLHLGSLPRSLGSEQQAMLAQGALGKVMVGGLAGQPMDINAFAASPAGAALAAGSSDSLLQPGAAPAGAEWQTVNASLQKERVVRGAVLGEKQRLSLSLVVALAQAGQAQRASELLTRLQATPGYQAELALPDEMLATAWLLVQRPGGAGQSALDEQAVALAKLPAAQAAPATAHVAAILASSAQLPEQSWQSLLAQAEQQWQKMPTGVMRDYAGSQMQRWYGQALLNALAVNAGKGRWQAAQALAKQLQQWQAANPGLVATALGLQAATLLGEAAPMTQLREQLASLALQAARTGDASLQLQQLSDHLGDIDISALLPQLETVVPAQAANLQPLLYGSLALLSAAGGQAASAAQNQQRVAATLGSSEGRDAQILALSVSCTTYLARYYLQNRQPALAEQQLRKAAAVVVPLLPEAAAAS